MKNIKIKKGCFSYTITLIIFLLSISFLARAKEIALSRAGVSESAANFKKLRLDNKNGNSIYEIEFIVNNSRYEFEINASNGSIIKFNKR